MKTSKDFVFLIVSKPTMENQERRERLINSIKQFVPKYFNYDILVEEGGNSWSTGLLIGITKIKQKYDLRYGVFNFDDEVVLLPDCFMNIEKYMNNYKVFCFQGVKPDGYVKEGLPYFVRVPLLFIWVYRLFNEPMYCQFSPFNTVFDAKKMITEPMSFLFSGFDRIFFHKDLLPSFEKDFVSREDVIYYEDGMFCINLWEQNIPCWWIPNCVILETGGTKLKSKEYTEFLHLSNHWLYLFYLFSRGNALRQFMVEPWFHWRSDLKNFFLYFRCFFNRYYPLRVDMDTINKKLMEGR